MHSVAKQLAMPSLCSMKDTSLYSAVGEVEKMALDITPNHIYPQNIESYNITNKLAGAELLTK